MNNYIYRRRGRVQCCSLWGKGFTGYSGCVSAISILARDGDDRLRQTSGKAIARIIMILDVLRPSSVIAILILILQHSRALFQMQSSFARV